jgi:hypothetical protein
MKLPEKILITYPEKNVEYIVRNLCSTSAHNTGRYIGLEMVEYWFG